MAYEQVAGPLGPVRAEIGAAIVALTVARALGGKKARRLKLADFLPEWSRPPRPEQSWQQQLAIVVQLNKAMGGEDRRGDDRDPPGEDGRAG